LKKRVSALSEIFKVNLNWYFTGGGSPFLDKSIEYIKNSGKPAIYVSDVQISYSADLTTLIYKAPDPDDYAYIPLALPQLSAGGGAFVIEEEGVGFDRFAFRREWLRRISANPEALVLMRVRGDSMDPTIADGDVVLVDTGRTRAVPGQIFAAIGLDDTINIKRLELRPGGVVLVISDNASYSSCEVPGAELRVIVQVVWYARELIRPGD